MRLAQVHPGWVLCFEDETGWSRFTQPALHAWTEAQGLRLHALVATKADIEAKAISCYGVLRTDTQQVMVRFVDGRPVSSVTIEFLEWTCNELAKAGKQVMLLV